jgi:hypothetical protein
MINVQFLLPEDGSEMHFLHLQAKVGGHVSYSPLGTPGVIITNLPPRSRGRQGSSEGYLFPYSPTFPKPHRALNNSGQWFR